MNASQNGKQEGVDRGRSGIPLRMMIPNAMTVLALCFGLTGARFATLGNWEKAVGAIILAGVLDGMDGRVARLLRGSSRFGAELDSLSDVIAFGVSPAIIIYFWTLHGLGGVGWIVALSLTVCCALRLARFNANLDVDNQPHKQAGFLTGVPSPVGAGLALSPIFLDNWLETDIFRTPIVAAVIVGATSFLMVSNLPTYSWKSVHLRRDMRLFALLGIGLFAASLFTATWGTLSLLSLGYAASIYFSVQSYRQLKARQLTEQAWQPKASEPDDGAASVQTNTLQAEKSSPQEEEKTDPEVHSSQDEPKPTS